MSVREFSSPDRVWRAMTKLAVAASLRCSLQFRCNLPWEVLPYVRNRSSNFSIPLKKMSGKHKTGLHRNVEYTVYKCF